jgi:exopolysaccharide biosynthesis WecB/TagA/CpsF family protein
MVGGVLGYHEIGGKKCRLMFGVQVSVLTAAAAIAELDERILSRRTSRIAFLNANLANHVAKNICFQEILSSFLLLNDGIGIDIASVVLYGEKFPDNLVGTDFIPQYLAQTKLALRIGLVGSSEAVVNKAAEVVAKKWPRHIVTYWHHGYFQSIEEAKVAQEIRCAKCDLILVGMGNPSQEEWISRNIPDVCAMGVGVGALFDYLTSTVPRAPRAILRLRLEWAYRVWAEPGRLWRRYLIGNVAFLARIAIERRKLALLRRQSR